jgi:uncharacterized protein YjlB
MARRPTVACRCSSTRACSAAPFPGPPDPDLAAACENLFEQNGWPPAWRASVHPFSHFHTRCHEALGVVRGSGRVQFGGASGRTVTCEAGRRCRPAGRGRPPAAGVEQDFLIVGAYPDNTAQRDQQRPGTIDHVEALRRIAAVPAPAQDPVFGKGKGRWSGMAGEAIGSPFAREVIRCAT